MNKWRIYYADGSIVEGTTEEEWVAAPDEGVQAIVSFAPPFNNRWSYKGADGLNHSVQDRNIWTGEDIYDPLGFGIKTGSLISTNDYFIIWSRACGDN